MSKPSADPYPRPARCPAPLGELAACLHLRRTRSGRLGCGRHQFTFYGGTNRVTGERSELATSSIIAIRGKALTGKSLHPTPPLSNRELFHRDRHICAYCAREFSSQRLTRDHVLPVSQGGRDTWMNVVTACRHCNQTKSGRTPEQARMELVYAPYVPNKAEYLILCNRNILADQMDFLARHVPSQSRVRAA
jgi:5-methylcytosine-specific restriction endonuclease McrA